MNENKKIELTTLNWVLSIGGIILLSLFIILPPVFRTVFKEEVIVEQKEPAEEEVPVQNNGIDDSNYSKITCVRQIVQADYGENNEVILAHENNLLRVYTINSNSNYSLNTKENESLFTDSKLACTNNKQSLTNIVGFNYNCDVTENSINETVKYDLSIFEVSNLPTDKSTLFSPSYTFNQDVTAVMNLLINDGYTCQ